MAVLLPVYNGERTISLSIQSILAQTFQDFMVYVVDDGSTDNTAEIVRSFRNSDRRIELHQKATSGIVDTLNVGLSLTENVEIIARHGAADISLPGRLELQVSVFDRLPEVVAISGAYDEIDSDGRVIREQRGFEDPNAANPCCIPQRSPHLPHPFLALRRSALEAVGDRYRFAFQSEDTDLYWRLRDIGRLVNTSTKLGQYRVQPNALRDRAVITGRICAVYSQLTGLAAIRRLNGDDDLEFPVWKQKAIEDYACTMESLIEFSSSQLDDNEKNHLRACASAKLLELAVCESCRVSASDIAFIGKWLRAANCFPLSWRDSQENVRILQRRFANKLRTDGDYRTAIFASYCFLRAIDRRNWRRALIKAVGSAVLGREHWAIVERKIVQFLVQ